MADTQGKPATKPAEKHEHPELAAKRHRHEQDSAAATAKALRLLGAVATFREERDAIAFGKAVDAIASPEAEEEED